MKSKLRRPITHPIEEEQVLAPQDSTPYCLESEMLTPSDIEQLRREAKEDNAYFQKAFAHLRRK
jgi:hypothetical protein